MKITAVVLCWNSSGYISLCLDSLKQLNHDHHQFEILVVDNNSTDDSVSLIRKKYPDLNLIVNSANLGYAAGNNVGIRHALNSGSDFVWIINADVTVSTASLQALLQAAENYPSAGIFGSKIYFAPGYEYHKDRYTKSQLGHVIWYAGGVVDWANIQGIHPGVDEVDHGQFKADTETDFVTGASMFVRKEVYHKIGLLDERYYLYYEENDFCQRAKKAGFKLEVVMKSHAWHANAQATGVGSPLQDYYISRNRMLFGLLYASLKMKLLLIKESVRLLFSGRPWQKKGIVDFYFGNFGRGSFEPGVSL